MTGSYDGTAKDMVIRKFHLQAHQMIIPLLWIIHNATVPQLDLIKRACKATKTGKEIILDIPSEDAKVFLSFPKDVQRYLVTRFEY